MMRPKERLWSASRLPPSSRRELSASRSRSLSESAPSPALLHRPSTQQLAPTSPRLCTALAVPSRPPQVVLAAARSRSRNARCSLGRTYCLSLLSAPGTPLLDTDTVRRIPWGVALLCFYNDTGFAAMVDSAGHIFKRINHILHQPQPGNRESVVTHANRVSIQGLEGAPKLRHRHDSPADDESQLALGQIGLGVELLPERPAADAQLGRVKHAVAAEAVTLALHPAAPHARDASAGGADSGLALARRSRKLQAQAHVAAGVQQLLVAFEARVHGHQARARSPQPRAPGLGVAAARNLRGGAPLRRYPWDALCPGRDSLCRCCRIPVLAQSLHAQLYKRLFL